MPEDHILFHIQGPDGDETARELFDLLRMEFSVRPERMDRETRWRKDPAGILEPVAVTAIVIALPAAALAASDPADPSLTKKRLAKVFAWASEKQKSAPQEHIEVSLPEEAARPIEQLDAETLLTAALHHGKSEGNT